MNMIAKEIKSYWETKSPYFIWDSSTLDLVSKTLTKEETDIILKGRDACFNESEEMKGRYIFVINKAFNRHNDIANRYTTIAEDGSVHITEASSITELDIRVDTLVSCNRNCVYRIKDFETSLLPQFPLEAIADLSQAIVIYNATHSA